MADNRLHCQFCHRFEVTGTNRQVHAKCGREHESCPKCFKANAKVAGAFPDYKLALNACPPAVFPGDCVRCAPDKKTRAELLAAGWHMCHWPTCNSPVEPKLWGCQAHWYRLPKEIRDAIWAAYVPGQEIRKDPSPAYIAAADAAERYVKAEIAAGRAV